MILDDENFLYHAIQNYRDPQCRGTKDLLSDLKHVKYIKRLLRRGEIKSERLVLNHIQVLHNVFGDAAISMLFFKVEPKFWPQLKTFLLYLNLIPKNFEIQEVIPETEIPLDPTLVTTLRKIR